MKPELRVAVGLQIRYARFVSTMKHRALVRMSVPGSRMRRVRALRRIVDLVMRRPAAMSKTRASFAQPAQHVFNIDNALHMHWHLRIDHTTVPFKASAMPPSGATARQPASSHARPARSVLHSLAAPGRTLLTDVVTRGRHRFDTSGTRNVEVSMLRTLTGVANSFAAPVARPFTTLAKRANASVPRIDERLALHRSDATASAAVAHAVSRNANAAAPRYASISLRTLLTPHRPSTRQDAAPAPTHALPAPRVELVWRRAGAKEIADAQLPAQGIESRATAKPKADPHTFTSPPAGAPRIDAANTERLADEVLRRVERQWRIERERRGL